MGKFTEFTAQDEPSHLCATTTAPFIVHSHNNQQADHMPGLIVHLLDVARIETGTLPIHPEPASVADLVNEARNAFPSGGNRHALRIELASEMLSLVRTLTKFPRPLDLPARP